MRHGFSLVELSIVLVILGLLTGGILAGQSLIRAAEMRAINTEFQRYTTAISSFRDKYFALPGDMATATSFWGTAAACPGVKTTAAGGTCNGDGNGQLSNLAATANEFYRFWQHLAYAGLVEGSYTGVSDDTTATTTYSTIGTNTPRSKMNNAGWTAYYLGVEPVSSTTFFDGNFGNVFILGAAVANNVTMGNNLKPEEAWNIDTKMDDGKPATGSVVGWEADGAAASTTSCNDAAASAAASLASSAYSLANTGLNCRLIFKTGY